MLICTCFAITDKRIRQAIRGGCTSIQSLERRTGAGTDCGMCRIDLKRLLAESERTSETRPSEAMASK